MSRSAAEMTWFDKLRKRPVPAHPASQQPAASGARANQASRTAVTSPVGPAARFLGRVGELQAIPGVATRLLQTIDDPSSSPDAIAREISHDQALLALVLRVANSAYYKSSGQVRDVTESIVVLGYDTTRQLVLGRLSKQVLRKNDVWQKTLWRHALATALAAQACARQVRGITVGHAFTAGLLHDLGKAVMHEALPDEVTPVWKGLAGDGGQSSDDAERAAFGTDHAEVGAELLRLWAFPEMYQLAARLHMHGGGTLADAKARRIVSIVALSDAVASGLGHDAVPQRQRPIPADHPALAALGAGPSIIELMQAHVESELGGLIEVFG